MKKVFVLGSINTDMVISADRLPMLGESLKGKGFMCNQGGKGANQAVACKKLGCDTVAFIGAVGKDNFGDELLKSLSGYGVDVSAVSRVDTNSGTCIIILDKSTNDNVLVVDAGANDCVEVSHVERCLAQAQKGDLFITQLEVNLDAVQYGLSIAKQKGLYTILNPAPVVPIDKEIYKNVDLLVLNETEAKLLSEVDVEGEQSALKCGKYFASHGVGEVVVTLGSRGSYYVVGDSVIHCPIVKTVVVDTTSAGDTFIGALAYKKAMGCNVGESLRFASACSSITVSRKGAAVSIPTYNEVSKLID